MRDGHVTLGRESDETIRGLPPSNMEHRSNPTRHNTKGRSMVVKFLARAAVTGLLLSIAAPVHGAAQEAAVTDSSFLQMAGSIGLLQAKLAKLAQNKASSPAVREFGKRMEADYAKVNQELAAGAK